jgi:hypothetical protein
MAKKQLHHQVPSLPLNSKLSYHGGGAKQTATPSTSQAQKMKLMALS